VSLSSLLFGPGERYEVLLDLSNSAVGDEIELTNDVRCPGPCCAARAT
jgi:hypothetical protein